LIRVTGDGQGEHPTQALLDSFCIYDQLGKLDGLTITMVGDLKYGRTVHSLSSILSHFDVKINFVSSETLRIPEKVIKELNSKNVKFNEILGIGNLNKVIPETDVLYMTRVQKERFPTEEAYKKEKGSYIVGKEFLDNAKSKPTLKVLHPLPRVDELLPSLDEDPRACYFQQVGYGLFTRMALLHEVLRTK
jgi:carbamoyl-phosphate synthase/aspartate carbamoyltransferase